MVIKISKQEFKAYVQSIVNTCDTTALIMVHEGLSSESRAYEVEDEDTVRVDFMDESGELDEYYHFLANYKPTKE